MQIPKVLAFTDKSNEKSMRLLKKCSMKIVGETSDDKMYKFAVLLNDEWVISPNGWLNPRVLYLFIRQKEISTEITPIK